VQTEKYYTTFTVKIRRLRFRALAVLSLTHFMRFAVIFGGIFLVGTLIEHIFRLHVQNRIFLFSILALSAAGLFVYYGISPLRAWLGRDERFSLKTLCLKVGETYPEIKDRMLNAIQLYASLSRNRGIYSPELIDNTMNRAGAAFLRYNFNKSIDYERLKKQLVMFGVLLLVTVGIIGISSGNIGSAVIRVLNPATDFPVPASFSFEISPGNSEIIRNDPFTVTARVNGRTPESVKIFTRHENSAAFEEFPLEMVNPGEYAVTLDKVRDSFYYFIRGRESNGFLSGMNIDSPAYFVRVIYRPMVRKLKMHLEYPDYSQLGSRYLEDNIGDVTALKGTKARIEVSVNKAVNSAELRFDGGAVIPMDISGMRAQASFEITTDARYHIHLEDSEGIDNSEPIKYRIAALPDTHPFIRIIVPGINTDLSEDKQLMVGMKINDDFGLSRLRLGYRLVDRDEAETVLAPENIETMLNDPEAFSFSDIPLENRQGMMQDVMLMWDMKSIQMFPEDQVLYFAEVYDNDRISGPKRSRSQTYTVRLPSIEELFEMAADTQEKEEEQLEETLEESRDLQEKLKDIARELLREEELDWEKKQEAEEAVRKQEEIQKNMEEIRKEIEKLVEKFEENDLLSADVLDKYKELQEMLSELATPEMQEVMKKLRDELENAQNMQQNRQNLENFRSAQEDYLKRIERTLNILKRLQIEQMMDELVTKTEKIRETQEMINAETDSLVGQSREQPGKRQAQQNQERNTGADRLSQQENNLSQRFDNLKETMSKLLEKMFEQPDISSEKLAEISDNTEKKEISEAMLKMSSELFRKALEQSLQTGEQISGDLKELEEELKSARSELNESQKQQILAEMRKAASNLLKLSRDQEDIRAGSANLTANSDKYTEIADKQHNAMSGLSRTIGGLVRLSEKTFFLTPELGKLLGQSATSMQESIRFLEERNKGAALGKQEQSMESLNEAVIALRSAMKNAQQSGSGVGFDQFMQQMEKMSGQQQGINQGTMDLMQQGGSLTMEQQAMMQRLAHDQELLRKSLEELRQEMQGSGSLNDRMQQLGSDMEEVAKQMHDLDVSERTMQMQERILSRMLDAQRSIHKRDFSKKRHAEAATQYRAVDPGILPENLGESAQFLQESLIRALSEGYTKDFEELIRRYFENLNNLDAVRKKPKQR